MNTIAKLIELALIECFDHCMIDWPEKGEPETFNAECEISLSHFKAGTEFPNSRDYFVIMCGVFTIIDAQHLEAWHSSRIHDKRICATKPCDYCEAQP